jgi:cell division protein FtsB
MMRYWRILLSLYAGLISGFFLLFFLGDAGVGKYRELSSYRERLELNVQELSQIHWALEQELKSLAVDAERVQILARELGYFEPDDGVIRVAGFTASGSFYKVGRIIERPPAERSIYPRIKIVCLVIPMVCYVIISMLRRWVRRDNKAKRP